MFLSLEMQTPRTPTRKVSGTADPAVWEATLAAALTPALSSAKPSEAFVAHLGRQLAREAQEQKTREQRLRVAGVVGGVLSLVGGLVFWLLWWQGRKPPAQAAGKPGWSWGWKPLSRAHPTQ